MAQLPGSGFFVKLNTRSAKDAPLHDYDNAALQAAIDRKLEQAAQRGAGKSEQERQNEEVRPLWRRRKRRCVCAAARRRWDCCGGLRAWRRIWPSSCGSRPSWWTCRWWCELVDEVVAQPQGEFRAFVGGNRLNAVSQYYSFCAV